MISLSVGAFIRHWLLGLGMQGCRPSQRLLYFFYDVLCTVTTVDFARISSGPVYVLRLSQPKKFVVLTRAQTGAVSRKPGG